MPAPEVRPVPFTSKLDCEGSEYAIMSVATRLNCVGRIVCEWHRASWGAREWDATVLAKLLTARGWKVDDLTHAAYTHGTLFARNPRTVSEP
jgi:hypothetical protein